MVENSHFQGWFCWLNCKSAWLRGCHCQASKTRLSDGPHLCQLDFASMRQCLCVSSSQACYSQSAVLELRGRSCRHMQSVNITQRKMSPAFCLSLPDLATASNASPSSQETPAMMFVLRGLNVTGSARQGKLYCSSYQAHTLNGGQELKTLAKSCECQRKAASQERLVTGLLFRCGEA